jgi:bla regulator protein blaR1
MTSTTTDTLAAIVGLEPEIGGRAVINQTGLTGLYDVTLNWTPNRIADANPDASGPSLFTALQEQLGLRLVETKGPVEVVVIDRIERPTEN